ncbi:hypothetical protein GBAR_LOCUS18328 [Geodia barretti]|uniref:Uncharacterized protein n=1 Tax=Geodia barretti TaxID=519541 RepID=A0AA35WTQ4_GEOBA|nr:hypothetical protein GBAR_LOCUS18328 [Geodia barretti]
MMRSQRHWKDCRR